MSLFLFPSILAGSITPAPLSCHSKLVRRCRRLPQTGPVSSPKLYVSWSIAVLPLHLVNVVRCREVERASRHPSCRPLAACKRNGSGVSRSQTLGLGAPRLPSTTRVGLQNRVRPSSSLGTELGHQPKGDWNCSSRRLLSDTRRCIPKHTNYVPDIPMICRIPE